MKRLFLCVGLALSLSFLSSCAQHDTKSPDTSGAVPYNQPGVGVDTIQGATPGGQAPNHSNDGTNNNQTVNTGDTASLDKTKQRQ